MNDLLEKELCRLSAIDFHSNRPVKILLSLFRGQRFRLAMAMVVFAIKQSPVWAMQIALGNIINATMEGGPSLKFNIVLNTVVMATLLQLNVPLHTLNSYMHSKAMREVQLNMRAALLMRLQQFSMSYFSRFNGGRLQAKILRDVEVIQALSRVMFDTGLSSGVPSRRRLSSLSRSNSLACWRFSFWRRR